MNILNAASFNIRVSLGTAFVLGLKKGKNLIDPTTAYLMFGERCRNNCAFCSQAEDGSRLSRVIWPEFKVEDLCESLNNSNDRFINICIQVTKFENALEKTLELVRYLKENINYSVNINVSMDVFDMEEHIDQIFAAGVNRLGFAIDCMDSTLYKKVKRRDYHMSMNLLERISEKYADRISTHIIFGLGESFKKALEFVFDMHRKNISLSVFAYTPVRKTGEYSKIKSPDIIDYRLFQACVYLIKKDLLKINNIEFDENEKVINIKNIDTHVLSNGEFMRTSGCKGCNRPFYNEKVGGEWYNFARKPFEEEIRNELTRISEFFE